MGPGFESNILVLLIVAGAISGLAWLFRSPLRRAVRYFQDWAERDKRAEIQAAAEKVQREQAEAELREKLVESEEEPEAQTLKGSQ